MNREQRSGWLLAIMTAALVFVVTFGMIYINHTAERFVEQSERRDCDTLRADIGALEEAGQLTESGARLTTSRRNRYAQIGCEPHLAPPTFTVIQPSPTTTR